MPVNRNELIEYLRDPSTLSEESVKELETVLEEAPYFQSARMLLAKGSKTLGLPSAKKYLASAAIYATDRPLLKKYISGQLLFLTKPPEKVDTPPVDPPEPVEEKQVPTPDAPQPEKATADDTPAVDAKAEELAITDKPILPGIPHESLDAMLNELQQDMQDLKSARSKFVDVQKKIEEDQAVNDALEKAVIAKDREDQAALEKQQAEEAKQRAVEEVKKQEAEARKAEEARKQAEEAEKKTQEGAVKKQEETKGPEEAKVQEPQELKSSESTKIETPTEVEAPADPPQPEVKEEEITTPRGRFTSASSLSTDPDQMSEEALKELEAGMWGDEREEKEPQDKKPQDKKPQAKEPAPKSTPKTTKKPKSTTTSAKKQTKKTTTTKKTPSTAAKKTTAKKPTKKENKTSGSGKKTKDDDDGKSDRKQKQQEIIDRFIKESPSITKAGEASPGGDLSGTSSEWKNNLGSEYLAEIYLNQGNKKRAIEIYESLGLKFPEKKSYFADLIAKIK